MIKYLLILINSIAVFLYSLFSGDGGVTVTGTFPASITAGQEAQVEIKITKGAMSGFAKLQMELPEGMAVKETENKGANYTFSNGIAKWVWASLPPESEILIKIKLITSEEASGVKAINAKFSYVENNAKQVSEMTPTEITIVPVGGAAAVSPTATPTETTAANPPATESVAANPPATETTPAVSEPPVATETPAIVKTEAEPVNPPAVQNNPPAANNQSNSNVEPPGNITVARTVTKISDNEYAVSLKIKKGITKGFARYSDDAPDGATIKAVKTEGSSFSVSDGKLKFVWVTVPNKEELDLEYTITAATAMEVKQTGEYSYLEENQSKKYTLAPETISLMGQAVASEPAKTTAQGNEIVTTETKTQTAPETAIKEPLSKKEGSINYHVQIGAFTNAKVNADRLKKVFHVTEAIDSEMQGGFSKFMVGAHDEYKGARDHREVMKNNNGIKSAFVVAYNGAKRITVQEALMITNQKWFK